VTSRIKLHLFKSSVKTTEIAFQFNAGANQNVCVQFGGFSCVSIELNTCPQTVTFPNQVTVKYFRNSLTFLKNSSFTMILGINVLNEPAAST